MIYKIILIFFITMMFSIINKKQYFNNKNKLCDWCIKPYLPSDNSVKKQKIHNDFFTMINLLNIPWQLQYGSLLGAVRNHGPIKHDGDVDIILLVDKNDLRFKHNNSKKNDILNRRILLKLLDTIINSNEKFKKFYLVINAYDKNGKKIYNNKKNYSDDELKITGYYVTLSIAPKVTTPKLKMNYPYVFDISLKYGTSRDTYIKRFGNTCNCNWNNKIVNCPKGALKHLYGWYGPNFMESQQNIGTNENRIYGKKNSKKELIKMNTAKYRSNDFNYYNKKYGIKGFTLNK